MTNLGVVKYMESLGIEVFKSKVGDRYVIQDMLSNKAYLGGEQSGHLIFLEYNTTGDGIVSALQVLRIMQENGMSLSKLAAGVQKFPQALINIAVSKKPPLEALKLVKAAIQDVEHCLADEGRVLVRYSGTENLCRVMVEGNTCEVYAKQIAKAVQKEIGQKGRK